MELEPAFLSRLQYAFVIGFRVIFPSFTIGLAARGRNLREMQVMLCRGLGIVALIIPVQLLFGHLTGEYALHYQPAKFAAIEARWQTEQPAGKVLIELPVTNLIMISEVDWCDNATLQTVGKLQSVAIGQPWVGMAAFNPFNMFGKEFRTEGHWAGWLYAADADTGIWKWRVKSNYPVIGATAVTSGGVAFFGDIGGNFYALDAAAGEKLWGQDLGGAIAGGVITDTANGTQKVAVAAGFTMLAWPMKIMKAQLS